MDGLDKCILNGGDHNILASSKTFFIGTFSVFDNGRLLVAKANASGVRVGSISRKWNQLTIRSKCACTPQKKIHI